MLNKGVTSTNKLKAQFSNNISEYSPETRSFAACSGLPAAGREDIFSRGFVPVMTGTPHLLPKINMQNQIYSPERG